MKEYKILAPTGIVGYGFPEDSFYAGVAQKPDQLIGNWTLFNAVSEYARVWGGFVKPEDVEEYMELQIATQVIRFDEGGIDIPFPQVQVHMNHYRAQERHGRGTR